MLCCSIIWPNVTLSWYVFSQWLDLNYNLRCACLCVLRHCLIIITWDDAAIFSQFWWKLVIGSVWEKRSSRRILMTDNDMTLLGNEYFLNVYTDFIISRKDFDKERTFWSKTASQPNKRSESLCRWYKPKKLSWQTLHKIWYAMWSRLISSIYLTGE